MVLSATYLFVHRHNFRFVVLYENKSSKQVFIEEALVEGALFYTSKLFELGNYIITYP